MSKSAFRTSREASSSNMEPMHVFVKIQDQSEIQHLIQLLRSTSEATARTIASVESLSMQERQKIDEWKANFTALNEKISQMAGSLGQPEDF